MATTNEILIKIGLTKEQFSEMRRKSLNDETVPEGGIYASKHADPLTEPYRRFGESIARGSDLQNGLASQRHGYGNNVMRPGSRNWSVRFRPEGPAASTTLALPNVPPAITPRATYDDVPESSPSSEMTSSDDTVVSQQTVYLAHKQAEEDLAWVPSSSRVRTKAPNVSGDDDEKSHHGRRESPTVDGFVLDSQNGKVLNCGSSNNIDDDFDLLPAFRSAIPESSTVEF